MTGRVSVLNALRHQWNPHLKPDESTMWGGAGAQRLAASMDPHPHRLELAGTPGCTCSTPCGINGILARDTICRLMPGIHGAQRLAASMESSLASSAAIEPSVPGAQRLAASMESSLVRDTQARRRECSTPCGINGILTANGRGIPVSGAQRLAASMESSPARVGTTLTHRRVLNALRHQWNPHSVGRAPKKDLCAQRLAASMESSLQNTDSCCLPSGAQRLAASMESSQDTAVWRYMAPCVLNALRHQWNPH